MINGNNGDNNDKNPWSGENEGLGGNKSSADVGGSTDLLSMIGLLAQTSSTQGGRIIPELELVKNELNKTYEAQRKDTINQMQSKMAPQIADISVNVSPVLPGIVLQLRSGNTVFISPFLFYNKNVVLDIDEVQYYIGQNNFRQNSPRVPASYINKMLFKGLEAEFKQRYGNETNIVNIGGEIINMDSIVDLKDQEQLVKRIKDIVVLSWETSFMTQLFRSAAEQKVKLPSVAHGGKLFGSNGTADARINAIMSRMGPGGTVMPSNMEIQIATTNPNNNGYQPATGNENAPREISRIFANVMLCPYNYNDHLRMMNATRNTLRFNDGMTTDGYKPFRPIIALNHCQAGPQLNSNAGIIPLIMGLTSLMASNNNYAFAEVIRRPDCGVRGSLVDLETRLDEICRSFNVTRIIGSNSIKLDNKKIQDVDAVSAWIRQHVMQAVVIALPIIPGGSSPALTRFILDLDNPATRQKAIQTFVAAVDALSDNKMTEMLQTNTANRSSNPESRAWITTDKIYHGNQQIVIDGTAQFNGRYFNLGELDEMGVYHMFGPNGYAKASEFLSTMYMPRNGENLRARQQRLRALLAENSNITDLNINGFGHYAIMDPRLMQLVGQCISSAGTLNTSGMVNSFNNTQAIYAPGTALAVDFVFGSNAGIGGTGDIYGI